MKSKLTEELTDDESDLAATRELQSIAQQIEEWRKQRPQMTKAELLRRYPGLGDDRTFGRCLSGDTTELSVEKWLVSYRQVQSLLELEPEADEEEEFYNDLTPAIQLRTAFTEIARERGNARVIVLLGWPGLGKTTARMLLEKKFGQRVITVEATRAWQKSHGGGTDRPLLRAIAKKLGLTNPPSRGDDLLDEVVALLSASRRLLIIEESHHLCPDGLDVVKTLVNLTPGEFLLIAHPRLWEKLESKGYSQCRQLTTNRLGKKITLRLTKSDVVKFVERRLPGLNGDTDKAATLIYKHAQSHGNFAFVRGACRRTRTLMREKNKTEPTLTLVSEAATAELNARDVR